MVNKEAINKFKLIYLTEFGQKLSDQTASEMATNFLNLMREIIKPISDNELKKTAK